MNEGAQEIASGPETENLVRDVGVLLDKLVAAAALPRAKAARVLRAVAQSHAASVTARKTLASVLLDILRSVDAGILTMPAHYVRLDGGRLALHMPSTATAMFRARRATFTAHDLRHALRFGRRAFGDVVVAHSVRVSFGEGDRRRATVIDVDRAYAFVAARPIAVPSR